MECWGARGGSGLTNNSVANSQGKGGYSKGVISITTSQTFYVYVGDVGTNGKKSTTVDGGWNGGGQGCPDGQDDEAAGGGGGATDIRVVDGSWNDVASLCSRIMVAGGGGGGSFSTLVGGCGGGLEGGFPSVGGVSYTTADGQPSKQNTGYQFGTGQNGVRTVANYDVAGGGGGYYGGRCSRQGTEHNGWDGSPGYGGSGFVSGHTGCNAISASVTSLSSITHSGQANHYSGFVFTNTKMIDGAGYAWTTSKGSLEAMPNPTTASSNYSSGVGHNGAGYARITLKPYE